MAWDTGMNLCFGSRDSELNSGSTAWDSDSDSASLKVHFGIRESTQAFLGQQSELRSDLMASDSGSDSDFTHLKKSMTWDFTQLLWDSGHDWDCMGCNLFWTPHVGTQEPNGLDSGDNGLESRG